MLHVSLIYIVFSLQSPSLRSSKDTFPVPFVIRVFYKEIVQRHKANIIFS